jgi:transcriptional regulator with XRE-family HTH domain
MADVYEEIGRRIREYRRNLNGTGISQEVLAEQIGTNANSISRWETAAFKPTIYDLEKLANFFNVPIAYLLPQSDVNARVSALLSATRDMDDEDLEEVFRYALFRRAMAPVNLQTKHPRSSTYSAGNIS